MDFEKQENGNLVYEDETGKYTMVDMGVYVGSRSRDWYEESPSCWKLMFFDGPEENPVHIRALVDHSGEYSKISVEKENNSSSIIFKYGDKYEGDNQDIIKFLEDNERLSKEVEAQNKKRTK